MCLCGPFPCLLQTHKKHLISLDFLVSHFFYSVIESFRFIWYTLIRIVCICRNNSSRRNRWKGCNVMPNQNNPNLNNVETIDLLELFYEILRHIWVILAVTLVTGAATFFYVKTFVTPQYESSALMIVNTRQDATVNVTSDQINSAVKLVDTYSIIIKSRTVLQQVVDDLDLVIDYKTLYDRVTVSDVDTTQVIKISVQDPNPQAAQIICDQITAVAPAIIMDKVEAGSVKVIESATMPTNPVSPRTMRTTALGMMLALVVCVGVIVLRVLLNNKINTEDDVEKYLGLPVLGVIPKTHGGKK